MSLHSDLIQILSTMPDRQLATPLADKCREFSRKSSSKEEQIRFMRDLRDMAVYIGGASSFVMATFSAALDDIPETEEDREARQAILEHERKG